MSKKPGRNDPCSCGSGKKYKRCCLPKDEAAARETARQQALFAGDAAFDDPEFDEDDDPEEFSDIEEDTFAVDVRAITRVSSTQEHRGQPGTCALCGEAVSRASAQKHVASCAPAHDVPGGTQQRLVHLRVTAPGLPAYWLDVEAKAEAKLEALDAFLRRIWLECCGHLSAFKIGAVDYFSRGYELGGPVFGRFGRHRRAERSMNARLRDALPSVGERFDYEYDFGSTTSLQLKMVGERAGQPGRAAVRLLARNTSPVWPCAICGQPATLVCTYCLSDDRNAFVCTKHRRKHACGEDEGFMPVVNSPRMGVCGYTAET